MSDPIADTEVAATVTSVAPSAPSTSRIPASPGADYPELVVVDPEHYVVERELAHGGMGRIHVARDRRLGREVAIKEVLIDNEVARARFVREARITARLQHPSIVSVHEAGRWPTGEPFFAMRLVNGQLLDAAVAAAPTFEARIGLVPNVLAVANAMAYAHGQRVIHRDIKPHNIMVAEFGETVLLDWGLAKDLTDLEVSLPPLARAKAPSESQSGSGPGETTVGDVLGTPAYMPPEQARGGSVDARADVYSIGAVLYHVLAGRSPYTGKTGTEILSKVIDEAPPRMAELAPRTPGELIAIVERAMAREPQARYATARELAEDLQRFQTGQLVGAHRYSLRQLLVRWMRRNRTVLIASAAAVAAAITIGVVALQRIVAANRLVAEQRAIAMANADGAEDLLDFMLVDLGQKLRDVGRLDLLDAVARRAAAYYDRRGDLTAARDVENVARARAAIGGVFYKRGNHAAARTELEKAKASYEQLLAGEPANGRWLDGLAGVENRLAGIASSRGEPDAARAQYQQALAHAELARQRDAGDNHAVDEVIQARRGFAELASSRGDSNGALEQFRAALADAKTEPAGDEPTAGLRNQELLLGKLAELERGSHDLDAAIRDFREALRIAESVPGANDQPLLRHDVAEAHESLAYALLVAKQYDAAEPELARAAEIADPLVEIDPSHVDWVMLRSNIYEKIGMLRMAKKDLQGASAAYHTSYDITREVTARDPSNLDAARGESVSANKLGDIDLALNDFTGALASYKAALATREKLVAADPHNADWARDLFYSHLMVANAYDALKRPDDVRAELEITRSLANAALKKAPADAERAADVVGTDIAFGDFLEKQHDRDAARSIDQEALDVAQRFATAPHAPGILAKALKEMPEALARVR